MIRKYPVGIQQFEKIRNDDYLYIDKTNYVYKLASTGGYFFLSRPRRFGKSLFLSTLEAYFQGKKHLFKGLAIEEKETEWTEHPVLHLDLNARNYVDAGSLYQELNKHLEMWEDIYDSPYANRAPEERFYHVIKKASKKTGKQVVILIDEYDKPLLQTIGSPRLQSEYRNLLKSFYGVMKSLDGYIRFAMLTGVTKFGKVSIFSDLNNLYDISMLRDYACICGITEKELQTNFTIDMKQLAEKLHITYDEVCNKMKNMYNGYHFTRNSEGVYNPFSLMYTFRAGEFGSYWFDTGTPTYLVTLLQQKHTQLSNLDKEEVDAETLDGMDVAETDAIPVLYQSGYLTIKGYDDRFDVFKLGFPNKEVEFGFVKYLLPFYANVSSVKGKFEISKFVRELETAEIDNFFTRLQSFFADIPYEMIVRHSPKKGNKKNEREALNAQELELHYQNVLFIVFRLMGFYTYVEYHTARGRIDLLIKTKNYYYVMEFKLNGSAEQAIAQIEEKDYALAFTAEDRKIFKIGVNFSSKTRNIEKWIVVENK